MQKEKPFNIGEIVIFRDRAAILQKLYNQQCKIATLTAGKVGIVFRNGLTLTVFPDELHRITK
jgi:hypothetical protein